MICSNISVNEKNHLCFAGFDTTELAKAYGSPLYLYDEELIRQRCRLYSRALEESFGPGSRPLYAGKAACFRYMYEIMAQEDMCVDLVSAGEIYTALKAGFPMERSYFHGSSKTDEELAFAIESGVGCIVVDGFDELYALQAVAAAKGVKQRVLLRLTPGIDPHTYEAVATGKVDSKFGVAIETGQAEEFVTEALKQENLILEGYHCHVGSMVFDEDGTVYHDTAVIMLRFIRDMNEKYGLSLDVFNIGGGYGVRYTEKDPGIDIAENIRILAEFMKDYCEKLGMKLPRVLMEPGRSIVADAGMTLYTVTTVKSIPGYKNYVSVDGGMTDNPRYALYGSEYTVYNATAVCGEDSILCDLVGRCCESGDIVQPDVTITRPGRGDIVAVCITGAYNFSMASSYNRVARLPVIMLRNGESRCVVRRETLDDIIERDI